MREVVTSPLQVGNYYAIAFDLGDMLLDRSYGGYLALNALTYFSMSDLNYQMLAESMGVRWWRSSPAVAVFGYKFETAYAGSIPTAIEPSFAHIDVARNVLSLQGDKDLRRAFALMAGGISSSWEKQAFEYFYNASGVSTVNIFEIAARGGVPIYRITSANADKIETLEIPATAREAIRNAVNQGLEVLVPARSLVIGNWTGVGWLVIDPTTGANAWMIGDDLGNVIHGGSGETYSQKEYYESRQPNSVENYVRNYQASDGDALKRRLSRYGNRVIDTSSPDYELGMGVADFMVSTAEFRSNSQSIAKKKEYLSERGRAGAYKKWANRYGDTPKGREYLAKFKESSRAAKAAYSEAKSLESFTSKAKWVKRGLGLLAAGLVIHDTYVKVKKDLEEGNKRNAAIDIAAGVAKIGAIAVLAGITASSLPAVALVVVASYAVDKGIDYATEWAKS
jgi:hypothetical protein